MALLTRQLKVAWIDAESLQKLMQGSDGTVSVTVSGLPENTQFRDCWFDAQTQLFGFMVYHPSFESKPLGSAYPEVYLAVRVDKVETSKPWKRGREFL